MKILLVAINSKYIHSNLAVYTLRANAGIYKDRVEIAEYTINNRQDDILAEVYKKGAHAVCFSCYIWNIEYVTEIAEELKKISPDTEIWAGGPEVSYEVEKFLKEHPCFSGVMIGEGENTFREMCGYFCGDTKSLTDIAGIAVRDDSGEIVFTKGREPGDMSAYEFAYDTDTDFSNRIIYYESSRGCPFSCSYCLSSVDKHLRFRDITKVKEELKFFIDQKVPQIKFVDRTFNCKHDHAMAIWQFIKDNDNGVTNFHFEISADLINDEELNFLSGLRPGLIQLEIGVQSTNPETIKEIHRSMKLSRVKEVTEKILGFGNIHQHLDLIAGLPYEDYETFIKSYDEIYSLHPNQLQLGFLKVLKGSFMYEHAKEYEVTYHHNPPYEVLSTRWLSYKDVLEIKKVEEMTEVYYNSGQFEVVMKLLYHIYKSPFEFMKKLGDYYEEKGYFSMNHSRMRRFEILRDFLEGEAKSGVAFSMDMIDEALVFDLYYREKCKTRPDFAKEHPLHKEMQRKYTEKGKQAHVEAFHYAFPGKNEHEIKELPEKSRKELWVLFDYENRDPLDYQAKVTYLDV